MKINQYYRYFLQSVQSVSTLKLNDLSPIRNNCITFFRVVENAPRLLQFQITNLIPNKISLPREKRKDSATRGNSQPFEGCLMSAQYKQPRQFSYIISSHNYNSIS